jgi:hypothetical protein
METEILEFKGEKITVLKSEGIIIREVQDALDLMADSSYFGSRRIVINENQLIPEFFDLKSGIAGEILQKFSTYDVQLAIIGEFSKYSGKSLRGFIFESNKLRRINFVSTLEEAKERLTK